MELKPGSRWKSAVCEAEIVVVRPAKGSVSLECGGRPMIPLNAERPSGLSPSPEFSAGTLVGKRYADDETGLEALCSKTGKGSLSLNGRPIPVREAKKLPSSD